MHIALFTDSNIRYLDGVARIIQELMTYVRARPEHRLTVFHRDAAAKKPEQIDRNVTVHGVAGPIIGIPGYDAYPVSYLVSPKRRICRILKESEVDVLVTVTPYIPKGIGNSALYVARKLKAPLVGSFDVPLSWYSEYYLQKLFGNSIITKFMRWYIAGHMKSYDRCDMILVPSESMNDYVQQLCGEMDTAYFHRAVDSRSFNPTHRSESFRSRYHLEDKTVIMFAGRLALEKNLSALCDAFAKLRSRHDNVALLMVGAGPERERIEKEHREGIVFTGALFGEELRQAFASADLFAYSSVVDAGPMAILEAMASGLPVVVMRGGGTHEVVGDGETGFVADTGEEFEAGLERLVVDRELRSTMSRNARGHAESRDWALVWGEVLDALDATIRKHASLHSS